MEDGHEILKFWNIMSLHRLDLLKKLVDVQKISLDKDDTEYAFLSWKREYESSYGSRSFRT
jgi:hypothetical protein